MDGVNENYLFTLLDFIMFNKNNSKQEGERLKKNTSPSLTPYSYYCNVKFFFFSDTQKLVENIKSAVLPNQFHVTNGSEKKRRRK